MGMVCVVCGSNDRTLSPAASSRVRRARPRGTTLGHTHSNTMWATTITTTNTRYASEAHRLKYFAGHHHQQHAGQGSTITSLFSSPASSFTLVLLILLTFGLLVRHVAGDHPSLCPPLFFVRSPKKGYGMVWYGMVAQERKRFQYLFDVGAGKHFQSRDRPDGWTSGRINHHQGKWTLDLQTGEF